MNISLELAVLLVVQITILAVLGKRFKVQINKNGKIEISWERQK